MQALIIANGDPPSHALLQKAAAAHDLVLAADGAAHVAAGANVTPHIVCGDFDSVRLEEAKRRFPDARFVTTPDQDWGDLEKALRLARDEGADAITILGAGGGRPDHTLANFALLLRYASELPLVLLDDYGETRALVSYDNQPATLRVGARPGDTISLISFTGAARVSLAGVQWPLTDHLLEIGTHGVSNEALSNEVTVTVCGGAVFVCRLNRQMPAGRR